MALQYSFPSFPKMGYTSQTGDSTRPANNGDKGTRQSITTVCETVVSKQSRGTFRGPSVKGMTICAQMHDGVAVFQDPG